jgi:hypothetical protein
MIGGSDAHYYKAIGYTYTEFEGKTEEELKRAILNKEIKIKGEKSPLIYIVTPILGKLGMLK